MRRKRRILPRRGFALVEMLAIMGAVGLALALGTAGLVGGFKVQQSVDDTHRRLTTRIALTDEFRADVARAVATRKELGDLEAGPTCLILRLADGSHVYYRWHKGSLERGTVPGPARPHGRSISPDGSAVEFRQGGPGGRLITLRVTETNPETGQVRLREDISAALGGDLR
jgi:hypothetical protein